MTWHNMTWHDRTQHDMTTVMPKGQLWSPRWPGSFDWAVPFRAAALNNKPKCALPLSRRNPISSVPTGTAPNPRVVKHVNANCTAKYHMNGTSGFGKNVCIAFMIRTTTSSGLYPAIQSQISHASANKILLKCHKHPDKVIQPSLHQPPAAINRHSTNTHPLSNMRRTHSYAKHIPLSPNNPNPIGANYGLGYLD